MISTCERSRDMKLNRYFDTGTFGGGLRTPKPDPVILCLHASLCQPFRVLIRVPYPLSGHTIHYTKIDNFYHSSKLHKFECMFLHSCFFFFNLSTSFWYFQMIWIQTYFITPTPLAHFDPGPFPESKDSVPAPMLCSQRRSWIWQMIRPSEIGIIYIYIWCIA